MVSCPVDSLNLARESSSLAGISGSGRSGGLATKAAPWLQDPLLSSVPSLASAAGVTSPKTTWPLRRIADSFSTASALVSFTM